jgi:hypothetical protein
MDQEIKVTWTRRDVLIIESKESIAIGSRRSCLSQDHVDALKPRQRRKAAQ